MPSGPTTVSSLGDSLQTIIDEARMRREYGTRVVNTVDKRTLPKNTGLKWEEIAVERIDAQDIDEDTELNNFQQLVDTLFSVEPVQSGIATFMTYRAKDRISTKTLGETGGLMQNALERKKDKTGIVVFDSFSSASSPGAGGTLTQGHIGASAANVREGGTTSGSTAEPWGGALAFIGHSFQVLDIENEPLSGIGTYPTPNGLTESIYRNGFKGMCRGVEVFIDDLITIDGSDDAKGCVFASGKGGAIVFVQGSSPRTMERENPARGGGGIEVYMYDDYAYGIRNSNWGREQYSDATRPTS